MKRLNELMVDLGEIISPSTLDWPGHASMVIFLNGCNLRCPYCSNHKLLDKCNLVPLKQVYKAIDDNRRCVNSLVLSGGEALCQFEAVQLLARYARGFDLYNGHLKVGLHTNGYDSIAIDLLSDQGYLNAVMLDIKPCSITPVGYWDEVGQSMKSLHDARYSKETLDYVEARITIFNQLNNDAQYVDTVSEYVCDRLEPDRLYIQQGDWTLSDNKAKWDILPVMGERLVELARVAKKNAGVGTKILVRSRGLGEIEVQ